LLHEIDCCLKTNIWFENETKITERLDFAQFDGDCASISSIVVVVVIVVVTVIGNIFVVAGVEFAIRVFLRRITT
jgi:hypothetical protein